MLLSRLRAAFYYLIFSLPVIFMSEQWINFAIY
mgnify:FL=1|jgi:hypothetical protein